jgi:hypothetical protein
VTTYPAIVTLRRAPSTHEDGQSGELRFLNIKSDVPKDLARAFRGAAQAMPRARIGDGSWQLEGDRLAALRAKIKAGRRTLSEVYGPPLYGIKTGLNEAFIVSRERRDELVARDPRSADLLVPFLRGENIKRWRIESEDLFLINIPKGKRPPRHPGSNPSPHPEEGSKSPSRRARATRGASFETQASPAPQDEVELGTTSAGIDIDDYPAIRDHLLTLKDKLEARATKQEWFELQQAQLAYQPRMAVGKIAYQDVCNSNPFMLDRAGFFLANTCYFIDSGEAWLAAFLNSRLAWFFWCSLTTLARGGYLRLFTQFVEQTPLPEQNQIGTRELTVLCTTASEAAAARFASQESFRRRIPDLCPSDRKPILTTRLQDWWKLDFQSFHAEVKKAFKEPIPLKQRSEWESFLREEGETVRRLSAEIEKAEREIDKIVYALFDLASDEIALLESSLAGRN